ncbi:amidohydrolase [Ihubacter sp. mB4P-1]|uniref:amidohydrolase n=1 Tax=Ihubacter sp. mB4P-1 TaxID=3242370 RepID=UPI003C7C1711
MQTIYYGGPIITMEGVNDRPEAVLVDGDKIGKVGTLREVMDAAGSRVKKVNLAGRCLMPGFIDAHGHISMNGQMSLCADLSECTSFDEIIQVMKAYISENKIGEKGAVIGFGYDHNFLKEQSHPGKAVLDQVSSEIPILILHISGHLGCVNSRLLEIAGITADTPDPQGGKIGRVDNTLEPDGYLEEAAMLQVQSSITQKIKPDLRKLLRGMQQIYIENGVTTAQDGAANGLSMKLLKLANSLGTLKIDVVAYPLMSDGGREILKKNKSLDGIYKKHLKIGGYKILLDGSPQGRSAWMSQPYLGDDPDYCGYPWLTDEDAYGYALQAVNDNKQLLAHCNGDAASEQFLQVYKKALENSDNPDKDHLRPVMIHCQTVRNDQLDRMKELNMIASIFVGHVYYWADIHMKNFGEERGRRVSPVKDALDRGLVVNFHQDSPVTKPKMLHSVWCAVNRISREGNVIGEEQRIDVYDALKAVTINAAYEYAEEDTKGSLKEGKRADLVILDRSPLEVNPLELKDISVLETIKDGKIIYKK